MVEKRERGCQGSGGASRCGRANVTCALTAGVRRTRHWARPLSGARTCLFYRTIVLLGDVGVKGYSREIPREISRDIRVGLSVLYPGIEVYCFSYLFFGNYLRWGCAYRLPLDIKICVPPPDRVHSP